MNLLFTKEREELKKAAAKFGKEKLNTDLIARDKRNEFSRIGWDACVDFGLQGMAMPQAYGGGGSGLFDIVAILEGIGNGCRDNGLIFSINAHMWGSQIPIYHFGSEAQKKRYLPLLCNGKWIGANAMTEPQSGSDVFSLKTEAVKEKDYYVLNGSKTFVTNAPIADAFIVYARTAPAKESLGISCFLVENGAKGLIIEKPLEKMGLRTSPMAAVVFQDCRVPEENLIGKEGAGMFIFNEAMEWERIFILASCVGAMEHQLEYCIEYARKRKVSNKPIWDYQSISHKIADMKLRLETSRLMLYDAVWLKDTRGAAFMESSLAKLHVSESYVQNSREAVQILGGYGYMVEYEIERELRDALASTIYSGTSEIQRNIISGLIGL